jgi:predicted AAA+ superfamily ATPase
MNSDNAHIINPNIQNSYMGSGMQNMLQFNTITNLASSIKTGNPLFDAILYSIIFSIVTAIFSNVSNIPSLLEKYFGYYYYISIKWLYETFFIMLEIIFGYKRPNKVQILRRIDYYTDNKKINESYNAIYWYLTNKSDINYIIETPVKFTFEKRIDANNLPDSDDIKINKVMDHNKTKEFKYKDYEITYYLGKETVTVYGETERKKENPYIVLYTTILDTDKTDVLEDFTKFCIEEYIKTMKSSKWEQFIYVNEKGQWKKLPQANRTRDINTIILKDDTTNEIKEDVKSFIDGEEWYRERDVPYTRGYMFFGLPGTGKSSMIKGISSMTKRHIHYLMLNNVKTDNELLDLFGQIDYKTTILVIEDIDCSSNIVEKRKKDNEVLEDDDDEDDDQNNVMYNNPNSMYGMMPNPNMMKKKKKAKKLTELTLSGLLNILDGVFNNHGRILIMTTNHIEKLDPALIRPGRIDRKFNFGNCSKQQISDMYNMFFKEKCNEDDLQVIEDGKFSPAYMTTLFMCYKNKPGEALKNISLFDVFDADRDVKPLVNI